MKLKDACKIGKQVGMSTVGESVDNIDHMSMSLFKYEDIADQLTEMYRDPLWDELNIKREDKIKKVIGEK